MSKLSDQDLSQLPQAGIDMLEDIQTIINFGKYQMAVVSAAPTWVGRNGEFVFFNSAAVGRIYVCTSDNTSNHWNIAVSFTVS